VQCKDITQATLSSVCVFIIVDDVSVAYSSLLSYCFIFALVLRLLFMLHSDLHSVLHEKLTEHMTLYTVLQKEEATFIF